MNSCRRYSLSSRARKLGVSLLLFAAFLLSGCSATIGEGVPPDMADAAAPEATFAAEEEMTTPVDPIMPIGVESAAEPTELAIPALALTAPVTPMGWEVVVTDDGLTTEWQVPEESLGWHVNTAGAGAQANVLVSGHQALGAGLLAPLALGEVVPGQEILLTDADGRVFVYRITDVSPPIPLTGATEEEAGQLAALTAESDDARLTLLTGWPDFTTTHRIAAQAEFLGEAILD